MNSLFEKMSLCDLERVKLILEERLSIKKKWVDSERGYNINVYNKRALIYHSDENHIKLKKVIGRIEEIINSIN